MLTNADICLVLSQSIRDIVVERTGRKDNVEVLYNPCPTVGRKPKDDVGEKRILFAATLYREKGYLDLIDAFAKVYEKHPDWQLILAGNGSQEEGLMRINELGIQSGVTFLGWVSGEAKEREFRIASIFCLPSYAEGFPMAVLDAWAYGLPVVTTPVGGIPDIVIDGENGLLFNPGDKEALAIQLNRLIEDVELRNVLKGKSEELAFTIFNIKFCKQVL
jgi:glycosyltransferase involved in cell wall biosynthesis